MTMRGKAGIIGVALALSTPCVSAAQEEAAADSAMVRLLKSGRVKDEQQGTLIEMIGSRGSAADLGYLLGRATEPGGLSPENRRKALAALAEAASTRKVRPEGDPSAIADLIGGESDDARLEAIRLAGLWRVEAARDALVAIAADVEEGRSARVAAFEALARIGGDASRGAIVSLAADDRPVETRRLAVAALATIDPDAAADRAVAVLDALDDVRDADPLLDAFLDRQGGPDRLASAIRGRGLGEDAARLALRHLYSIGRTDPALVAALGDAAGIEAEPAPLTEAELQQLFADVQSQGDPARGEAVFRRDDVTCMKCHAVAKAGGNVGPDLSAIGATSPVDYLARSILYPEESVKEEYQVKAVLTVDGQVYQGIVKEQSADRVVLLDASGVLRVVATDDIDDEKDGGSLMPGGLTNLMTRREFVDLLAFLSQLGKPGPYAIRSTPTIQRWRVLPMQGTDSDAIDPDDAGETLPGALASADPSSWRPAYARVDGTLPLGDLLGDAGGPIALRGEVELTEPGEVEFRLDSAEGLSIWVDEAPVDPSERFSADLGLGRHALTIVVDPALRDTQGIRVEVARSPGSEADFTVVGGP